MEEALAQIVEAIRRGEPLDGHALDLVMRAQNKKAHDPARSVAKKRMLPFYLRERERNSEFYRSLEIDEDVHDKLVATLRAKPRRTASGVATITVLTKPWPCGGDCLYCPNDVRMPKSYLADEPACQRAERCYFDPYLQVVSRLRVLEAMGHNTDKVELIVLGGTFSDYAEEYQTWFVKELFSALNEFGGDGALDKAKARIEAYEQCGIQSDPEILASLAALAQRMVNAGEATYNDVVGTSSSQSAWKAAGLFQVATSEELEREQELNERSRHRNVGLVVETRPELVTEGHARWLRRLGCTKVQMGIQSLDPPVLELNCRSASVDAIADAFDVLRTFGFKSHVHYMVNLPGATSEGDLDGYRTLVEDARFKPDEVKLYPCALVESSRLMRLYESGEWNPYSEEELLGLLADCVMETPPYTRISRMIRDISSSDIVAGNKKTNLRQMVEAKVQADGVQEMRMREIATSDVDAGSVALETVGYETHNTSERFLQFVTAEGRLAAFLRLSLPKAQHESAMIREVHVYGRVSRLHESKEGTQHTGLGRTLVEEACRKAAQAGYVRIKVISAIGTRGYYRRLGFEDGGLYQVRELA